MTPARRFLIVTAVLPILWAPTALRAACSDSRSIQLPGYISAVGSCGTYCQSDVPNLAGDAVGIFWALGFGDAAYGQGIDSGSVDGGSWFGGTPPFIYPGYVYNYPRYVDSDWNAFPAIDGCVDAAPPETCTAILLNQQFDGKGYFAVMSDAPDVSGDFDFQTAVPAGGPVLDHVPRPFLNSTQSMGPLLLAVNVAAPAPAAGIYLDPSCPDPIAGFRVYSRIFPWATEAPVTRDRNEGWSQAPGQSTPTPLDQNAQFLIECPPGYYMTLATSLVFDSGWETPFLSSDSSIIDCGFCADGNADLDGSCTENDCDDGDPAVYGSAPQICGDGINNDCNHPGWPFLDGTNESDDDGDSFDECGGDCDDTRAAAFPGATELCNGLDDSCNQLVDDDGVTLDGDEDGVPQACDNCPADTNMFQDDFDTDLVGDACDNCIFDPNVDQLDFDGDLEGDLCDLDDGRVLLFFPGATGLEWQEEIGFIGWNLYRGDLAILRSSGDAQQPPGSNPLADRQCALGDPFAGDAWSPSVGATAFYLVSGELSGGGEDALGEDSEGAARTGSSPCP